MHNLNSDNNRNTHVLHIPISLPLKGRKSAGTYIVDLLNELNSSRYGLVCGVLHVNPVSFKGLLNRQRPSYLDKGFAVKVNNNYLLDEIFFKCDKRNSKKWVKATLSAFKEYVNKFGLPDIIHAHSGRGAGEVARLINEIYGIPYIVQEHNPVYLRKDALSFKEKEKLRLVYDASSFICPVSGSMVREIKKITDCESKIKVTPNIVNDSFTFKNSDVDNFKFIVIGRLDENKNIEMSIRAFHQATLKNTCVATLNIYGQGHLHENLMCLIKKLQLETKVTLHGYHDKQTIANELSSSACLLLSSHREPFGVPVLESLFCGCPVIASKSGGPEEISKNIDGIVLVDNNDIEAMTIEIGHKLKKPLSIGERKNISDKAIGVYGKKQLTSMWNNMYVDSIKSR